MFGLKINTNNIIEQVELSHPVGASVRGVIKGWVEEVNSKKLPYPYCMLVDEEGRMKGLELNPIASLLYGTERHGTPIVGDVVIVKIMATPEGPDLIGLTEDDVKVVNDILGNLC